jgi:hypothetical protein
LLHGGPDAEAFAEAFDTGARRYPAEDKTQRSGTAGIFSDATSLFAEGNAKSDRFYGLDDHFETMTT